MTEIIAGVRIPNSRLVDDVTELIRETTSALVFHHSRRVFRVRQPSGSQAAHRTGPRPTSSSTSCPASTASTSSTS
jgi:hypothetical protein